MTRIFSITISLLFASMLGSCAQPTPPVPTRTSTLEIPPTIITTTSSTSTPIDTPTNPGDVSNSSIVKPVDGVIEFAGYNWQVKSSEGQVGPGPNFFSDSAEDVFVDEKGQLHLRVVKRDGQWYVTEIINTENLGYGLYTFHLITPVDQLDPNIVLGLFTWDDNAPDENYREIDIEFSRWGQPENDNAQYVVQPWAKPANIHRYNVVLDNQISTHSFLWQPDGILFKSSYGHQNTTSFPADIQSWFYEGNDNPLPGNENIRINLWLRYGEAPINGQDSEVVISNFIFTPPPTTIPPTPIPTTESGDTPWIEVTVAVSDYVSGMVGPASYCNDNYRIVFYAKTDTWYVQPYIHDPLTLIDPVSCSWTSFSHPWNELAALLIPRNYDPPATLSSQSCPTSLPGVDVLASDCYIP